MKKLTTALVCAGLCLLAVPAHAGAERNETGNELLAKCTSESYFNSGVCTGYVLGTLDMLSWWQVSEKKCFFDITSGVTVGQITDVVVKGLKANPETRDRLAMTLVSDYVMTAWPCKGDLTAGGVE